MCLCNRLYFQHLQIRDIFFHNISLWSSWPVSYTHLEKNRLQNCLTVSNIQLGNVVSDTFGKSAQAIKLSEKIDMCINMEIWDATKVYDRMGIDSEYTEILGIRVPVMTIPVKPGRNLAVIIEVAAMNNRQKKMGYNAAQELLSSLGMDISVLQSDDIKRDLDI